MSGDSAPFNLTHHFLIAMPGLDDEMFSKSVVFLCEHSERGALGLIINKPSDINLDALFDKIDLPLTRADLNGNPVEVRVNALPISKMETFLELQGDVAAVVQLVTGRNADEFHPALALDIVDAADELNDPLAARLLKRSPRQMGYALQKNGIEGRKF